MSESNKTIKFYEKEYYLLSNFSAHKVVFKDREYMTAEHAYQAAKFEDEHLKEKIKNAPSARLAKHYGQTKTGRKGHRDKAATMKEILRAKLFQHDDVKEMLVKSGNVILEENSPTDSFWGTGEDGTGENMMGKLWMELREEMRNK
ncbi:MAG: NADAR family protein [Patescibacteria group bacterium]